MMLLLGWVYVESVSSVKGLEEEELLSQSRPSYECSLSLDIHSFFWAGHHGPLNENRTMGVSKRPRLKEPGFHDVFMGLFIPRQIT